MTEGEVGAILFIGIVLFLMWIVGAILRSIIGAPARARRQEKLLKEIKDRLPPAP